MPPAARLLVALATLTAGWYALFVSPALSGTAAAEAVASVPPAPPLAAPASSPAVAASPALARAAPAAGITAPAAAADAAAPVAAALAAAELDAALVQSRDAVAAKRWQAALEPTRQLVERFPGQHVYLSRLAEIYRGLGQPADEAATWERFVDRAPQPTDACPFIGHAYRKLGQYEKAIAAFERCYEADPHSAELAFFVGLGNEWAAHFETALEWYGKAIDLAPPHFDSLVGQARVQLHRNRLDQALRRAREVLQHVPRHVDAALVAGLAEQRAGHRVEARAYLEMAVSQAEDYFDVQLALGVLDYAELRYREARDRFEVAFRLDASRRDEVQPWLDRTANVKSAP